MIKIITEKCEGHNPLRIKDLVTFEAGTLFRIRGGYEGGILNPIFILMKSYLYDDNRTGRLPIIAIIISPTDKYANHYHFLVEDREREIEILDATMEIKVKQSCKEPVK